MARRGFRCARLTAGEWVELREAPWPSGRIDNRIIARGVDLLDCSRTDANWSENSLQFPFPLVQYWHLGVVHADGRVTAVYVNETKMK